MMLFTSGHSSLSRTAAVIIRVSFGLTLLLVGLAQYMEFESFMLQVTDGLGPLTFLAGIWAYILPALMILGGALLTTGLMAEIGVWAAGIALGSIPPGMILKTVLSGISLGDNMPWALNAFIWLLMFYVAVKSVSVEKQAAEAAAAAQPAAAKAKKK